MVAVSYTEIMFTRVEKTIEQCISVRIKMTLALQCIVFDFDVYISI